MPQQDPMNYSPRALRAKELFESGYNCCQATLIAFEDLTGLDRATSAKVASSFGGGIGRLREVCGTFTGLCMALGMIAGYEDQKDSTGKAEQYKKIQALAQRFKEDNGGSIICRELLGLQEQKSDPTPAARTSEYYRKRPCGELCAYATQILEDALAQSK